ncbi:uncharacterized protein plekhg4 isoform X3 [Nothobranchius furzeri]|uniref:uncharacterized protein plekhg4 isoform X3 n=1 Tax=Nothobranchius furzeri TaxID=105023 RepID=UPI003904A5C5
MDSESLDCCIQKALAVLFPPFQATSSTVLCQVLRVVDSCYRGDGLRYLLHFLLPAKHFLQDLQKNACSPYCGLLFRHEGWPLCLHEKVVIQLCPLDQHLLYPGDFYLLVAPAASQVSGTSSRVSITPRLLLCSVSAATQHVEQQELSDGALRRLFSMSWLDSINRDREQNGAARLEHCVLSAHGDVFRVPWEDVVYPQFNSQPQTALKEKKELTSTNKQDLNFSRQEVKILPFHTDQSAESSRDEESEGEYVELMELPRFSPQKGSLTQSISLQYRTRTTAHANTQKLETEKHTNTHTHEADENTNTHTCLRSSSPFAALTHTSLTHCDSNTHSSCSSVDVSSHTLTSRLIEEDFSEHSRRSISPSLVPSAPPDAKEQTEGTSPVTEVSPYQQQRGDEEGKEEMGQKEPIQEEEKELSKKTDVVIVPVSEEKRIKRRQHRLEERKCLSKEEVDESKVEGNEEEFEKVWLGEEVGVQNIQQCQEKGEEVIKREKKEEEKEGLGGGEKECVKRDSYFENEQTHTENSRWGNNILHYEGSYCGHIRQPHPTDLFCGNIPETRSKSSYSENNMLQSYFEDTYFENIKLKTHLKDFYCKNSREETHSEDSYRGNVGLVENPEELRCVKDELLSYSQNNCSDSVTEQKHLKDYCGTFSLGTRSKDTYSERTSQTYPENSYSESTLQIHAEDSCSDNTLQKDLGDSYFEKALQTLTKDSYPVNSPSTQPKTSHSENELQTHAHDSYLESTFEIDSDSYSENPQQTESNNACSKNELQTHAEVSCSKNTSQTQPKDSYSESTLQTDPNDSYFDNALQIHAKDSCSEKPLQTCPEDSYSESTLKTEPYDFKSENTLQTCAEGSCAESTLQTDPKDCNAESTLQKGPKDCYFERTLQIHAEDCSDTAPLSCPKDSYSESTLQICAGHACSENTLQTHPKDSYSESTLQICAGHACSENTLQTHLKDSYSESTLQICAGYACSENTLQTQPKDSYSGSTMITTPNDSYSESALKTRPNDSKSENTLQTDAEVSCSESTFQKDPKHSYFERTLQSHAEDSFSDNTLQSCPKESYSEHVLQAHDDSYSESSLQKEPNDSYFERTLQTYAEDSYSDITLHTPPKGSYSESKLQMGPKDDYFESTLQSQLEESYCESETLQRHADSVKFHGEQQNLEETNEEVDQEHSSEGFCGLRSSDHHTEGSTPVLSDASVSTGPSPEESEKIVAPPTFPSKPSQFSKPSHCLQAPQSSFYSQLLRSGAVCLPVWWNPNCDSTMLLRLLLYYTSTIRAEVRALGLTVLADARSAAPSSDLFSALESLQEATPGSVHSVLILANKDSSLHLDKPASTQVEVLCSLKTLRKHVDLQQLPTEFGGLFTFRQSSWITFTLRLQLLSRQCCDVINLLQKAVSTLQNTSLPAAAQDAELLLSRYKAVMNSVLGDVRLVQLQQEGGASLSWLRREEGGVSEEQRTELEEVSTLYNQVDELLHRLVTLSNARTQELNFILDFRNLEKGFNQVRTWLEEIGEVHLKVLREPADSLELLKRKQQDFKDFYTSAYDHCKRGEDLLAQVEHWGDFSSADFQVYEDKVHSFWAQLQDFSQRVKSTGQNIERAIQLFHFLDQAYNWALEGKRHLAGISMEDCMLPDKCQAAIGCLQEYQVKHPAISESRFQEMKSEAGELWGERGLRQWSFTWSTCQDTKSMFDQKMDAALQTRDSTHRQRSSSVVSRSSISSRKSLSGLWGGRFNSSPTEDEIRTSSTVSSTSPSQNPPLLRRLFRSSSSESSERLDVCTPKPSPTSSQNLHLTPSVSHSKRQQLKKTQSLDCPSTPNVLRCGGYPHSKNEPPHRGNTGVFIRGLEVSSTEAADRTLCPRTPAQGWRGRGKQSPQTPGTPKINIHRPQGSKLLHIVEEMVTTERDYVSSLRYIIRHYFPEMDQADLPQDLRGQRSVIFGNLEKLLDFHSQFFLRELEACWKHPLRVPHCFLRHREQFALYSLYSKNKPRSDALLANHGHTFFRRKQLELGDKMDLSSYLLKPIQRMSKYALLLTDLMKEVGMAQEAELTALQTATDMVKFQLRHGNDLLAMDAIRDCDVNLKEQGQLIRQDEFTVWTGRRKSQRHVFLFEEMVLFSKPKKMEGGLDVFIYKHSFKTADVGLTESAGNGGLRFEIWFRRRTSKNQNFILQASSAEVKHAWTSDITRILWTQATRNKGRDDEVRLKELVSMGVGNKPFLDIQPSDAAISDRAVHYITKSRGARTRASIAVSALDNSDPFKRGVMTSDLTASGPSSCSLLGPLNLHMYSQSLPDAAPADASFSSSCIEEDEQEHETSSQPSITTESSGSSSRCFSGSTDSDSGCVSTHLQEVLPGESSPPSQPSSSSSSSSTHNKQNLSSKHIYAGGADRRPT